MKHDRAGQPFNSPTLYRDWSRTLDRTWLPVLTGNEFAVLRFIFDRTAGWGKEWERIPLRHFIEGVVSKDGKIHGKTALSDKTVRRMLTTLVEMRAILIRTEPGGVSSYSINYEWTPMKIPKRLREIVEKEAETPVNLTGPPRSELPDPLVNLTGHKRRKEKSLREEEATATADAVTVGSGVEIETREELEAGIAGAERASRLRREAKKQDGYHARGTDGGLVPSVEAMRRTWVDLHHKHLPQVPVSAMPDKSAHMLRSYAKEWNKRNAGKEWTDYLEWVFANWSGICRTSLHWMTDRPDAPTPQMVASAKLRVYLEDGWQHRAKMEAIYALPPREREIRFLMLERGIGRDHAESLVRSKKEAVDAMAAVHSERERLEVAKAKLEMAGRAEAKARLRRQKEEVVKARVQRGLDEMTAADEDALIASFHAAKGKRRRKDDPEDSTTQKPERTAVVDGIPASFPAWDELD